MKSYKVEIGPEVYRYFRDKALKEVGPSPQSVINSVLREAMNSSKEKEEKMDDLLSRESAKEIEEWVKRHSGYIERTRAYNIVIHDVGSFTTILLKNWLDMGAHVYFTYDHVNISNWPEETKKFEVIVKGNINAEGLYYDIKSFYIGDDLISVKEK